MASSPRFQAAESRGDDRPETIGFTMNFVAELN
jgi:hypothetical protein